jgi:hypothetical protein
MEFDNFTKIDNSLLELQADNNIFLEKQTLYGILEERNYSKKPSPWNTSTNTDFLEYQNVKLLEYSNIVKKVGIEKYTPCYLHYDFETDPFLQQTLKNKGHILNAGDGLLQNIKNTIIHSTGPPNIKYSSSYFWNYSIIDTNYISTIKLPSFTLQPILNSKSFTISFWHKFQTNIQKQTILSMKRNNVDDYFNIFIENGKMFFTLHKTPIELSTFLFKFPDTTNISSPNVISNTALNNNGSTNGPWRLFDGKTSTQDQGYEPYISYTNFRRDAITGEWGYRRYDYINEIVGDWVKVDLQTSMILKQYKMYRNDHGIDNAILTNPYTFRIFGSKSNDEWTLIQEQSEIDWRTDTVKIFDTSNNNVSYQYYAILVSAIDPDNPTQDDTSFTLGELDLYGIPTNEIEPIYWDITSIQPNNWYHNTFTVDYADSYFTINYYIDNVQQGLQPTKVAVKDYTFNYTGDHYGIIANDTDPLNVHPFYLADFRIFDSVLSTLHIGYLYEPESIPLDKFITSEDLDAYVNNARAVTNLNTNIITTGELHESVIPDLNVNKITGILDSNTIPEFLPEKITSGRIAVNLIPELPANKITSGKFLLESIPILPVSKITGIIDYARLPEFPIDPDAVYQQITVAEIPTLNANKVTSGNFLASQFQSINTSVINNKISSDRISSLSAGIINSGSISDITIPDLNTSNFTSGIFNNDRIPSLNVNKIKSGTKINENRLPVLTMSNFNGIPKEANMIILKPDWEEAGWDRTNNKVQFNNVYDHIKDWYHSILYVSNENHDKYVRIYRFKYGERLSTNIILEPIAIGIGYFPGPSNPAYTFWVHTVLPSGGNLYKPFNFSITIMRTQETEP